MADNEETVVETPEVETPTEEVVEASPSAEAEVEEAATPVDEEAAE